VCPSKSGSSAPTQEVAATQENIPCFDGNRT
jgi:hypothetical protein